MNKNIYNVAVKLIIPRGITFFKNTRVFLRCLAPPLGMMLMSSLYNFNIF